MNKTDDSKAIGVPHSLHALGQVHIDDSAGTPARIDLLVDDSAREAGHGPITLQWSGAGIDVQGARLFWMMTTTKGWAHLGGEAWGSDPDHRVPFRIDMFAAASVGAAGPDRMAMRLYAVGADAAVASPTHKVNGWLDRGSILLGRDG